MNIKEAKEQIVWTLQAYFRKDAFGSYRIPIERQRPVFLMGPPGIGKTAIVEQVAQELGVGLVSYSMTHHTRQSALGLPFIEHKIYGGKEVAVSEYTMSEIIASVYDKMEQTGWQEGILFLDEVNCVSETLAPVMLQFLQYKVFGRHRVPDGWIIVAAGNPPEYNRSAREFDIVTWDRLKRIDIEPDFTVWKEYAHTRHIHAAVMTYLEIKTKNFYKIESTVDGKRFVTARGWCDMSDMIVLCEEMQHPVDRRLVTQYLQNDAIAKDFAAYYDLFTKYRTDYQIDRILDGTEDDVIRERAAAAKFDERLSLVGLLFEAISTEMGQVMDSYHVLRELKTSLTAIKQSWKAPVRAPGEELQLVMDHKRNALDKGRQAGVLSEERQRRSHFLLQILTQEKERIQSEEDHAKAFALLKKDFQSRVKRLNDQSADVNRHLSALLNFFRKTFSSGRERVILMTELMSCRHTTEYIHLYQPADYFANSQELLVHDRGLQLSDEIKKLALEDD